MCDTQARFNFFINLADGFVNRLVLDAEKMPLVVPFVHSGMQEIMPIGSQFPHVRKKVQIEKIVFYT